MSKNIAIKVAGSPAIHDVAIQPGTTAREILDTVSLSGYLLCRGPNDPPFGDSDVVYSQVDDGAKLDASTPAEAG